MKIVLVLLGVVFLGWLAAVLAIALFIFFVSLVAWVVITLRSPNGKKEKPAERSAVKRLVEQEQT